MHFSGHQHRIFGYLFGSMRAALGKGMGIIDK